MRIGLLAMSGIRAHDAELLELGLTLPGFVERSKAIASLPSLGLLWLAAVTPPGHEVRYFEAERDGLEPRDLYACDLVAISTFSAQVREAYAIADRLRQAGVVVAMGGLHVSVMPEEAAQHADHVVIGEGERVWPELVAAVESGKREGRWDAATYGPVALEELPVPRYELLDEARYNRFTVQTTRGCPWRCGFCASTVMLARPYRKRPVEHVVRDIRAIQALRRRPFIEFADDNTFVDRNWGKELCRQLAPLKVRWFTETDIAIADDEELLRLMKRAGCRQVLIGLESPSREPLEGVELRANFKAKQVERNLEAVRRIQAHGIAVNGCFILGLDNHTPAVFDEVYRFAEQAALFDVQITVLTAFPGTPLYERLQREGRLIDPQAWHLCTLFDINHAPRGMSIAQLRQGMHNLTRNLYNNTFTSNRRQAFFRHSAKPAAERASDFPP